MRSSKPDLLIGNTSGPMVVATNLGPDADGLPQFSATQVVGTAPSWDVALTNWLLVS